MPQRSSTTAAAKATPPAATPADGAAPTTPDTSTPPAVTPPADLPAAKPPVDPPAEPEPTAEAERVSTCVVNDGYGLHVGNAVNGKVCSYHAMHYDANGNRR